MRTNREWFWENITPEESAAMLQGQPAGTFLVRCSRTPGCLAVSYVAKNGTVKKSLVSRYPNGGFTLDDQGTCLNHCLNRYDRPNAHL
ncbi:phosphatidylinositol 3-kinase regulatory subunit alpha-like [Planoprotostelium fungivorum]|uniref:Phosphatidylinositol 3-kinase regulatory subunit alpha-like n=1 Tax=Planoprotostelium fungivorum TaxID=1890364 RepID=A0A2P6NVY6_9EUKA|nr:phosphatidylinositol 3-kinase regulatory subunit alpha-like [Planoprotostelium fungivorum]